VILEFGITGARAGEFLSVKSKALEYFWFSIWERWKISRKSYGN